MTAAEMFCERVLDGITNWDNPKARQDEENVAKSKGEGEKAKGEKLEDGGDAESAIDSAIAYLEREGDEPTRRNVFAKDWALKKQDGKWETSKTAQDELYEALVEDAETLTDKTLAEHDKERHPNGYHEGDTCKFREKMMVETETDKADEVDADKGGNADSGKDKTTRNGDGDKEVPSSGESHEKVYEGISKKKVAKYKSQMAKKHPELDADLILTELAKIGDPKLQGDAFAWVMKGAIKLPEDMYKVEQARELATKAKRDPLSWDTPQACINELQGEGHKIKEKPITVDELKKNPLMSDYRDEGYGVETFQVEDSREGQKLMRQIINTHWGKDANPWCLLHGDGNGNLSDGSDGGYDAWEYWQTYNALPKRVAFKDGKLLAFMATDKEEEWWDRKDESHDGIPMGVFESKKDKYHRKIHHSLKNGELIEDGNFEPIKTTYGVIGINDGGTNVDNISFTPSNVPYTYVFSIRKKDGRVLSVYSGKHGRALCLGDGGFDNLVKQFGNGIETAYEKFREMEEEIKVETSKNNKQHKKNRNNMFFSAPSESFVSDSKDELVSALLGENYVEDADTLPQGETLEEHDRKKHKGHFDPSTQTCKFREEMKKETDSDRADEISPESAPKADGGEDGGQKKPLVSPEEDAAYMEAVKKKDWSTAERLLFDIAHRMGFYKYKLYHGTPRVDEGYDDFGYVYRNRTFNVFNTKNQRSTSPKDVFWVSPSEAVAKSYAQETPYGGQRGLVIPLFVRIDNPFVYDAKYSDWYELPDGGTINDLAAKAKDSGYDSIVIENVRDIGRGGYYEDDDGVLRVALSDGTTDRDAYKTSIAFFNPSQAKSAKIVERDDNGGIIPLSRRFDDGDDIRGDVSVGGDDKPSSVEQEESENLESYDKNFTEGGEWKSPWGKGGPTPSVIQESRDKQSGGDEPIAKDTFELPNGTKVPANLAYLYKGMDGTPHNEKWSPFLEKTTGNGAISKDFSDVLDKLFSGELVDADTIKSIPEWKDAMAKEKRIQDELEKKHGVRTTAEINDSTREKLRSSLIRAAMTDHITRTVPLEGFEGMEFETNEGLKDGESYDVEKGRVMTVVIGLPAAGKSTTFANPLAKKFKARLCDSDTVKKTLPEFSNGYGGNVVHEESTKINEEILKRSIEQGDNIVYPILGYKPDKLKKLFGQLREKGYKINLCLKDMPANIALGRLLGRFMGKGRYLPIECITKAMGKFGNCFEQVKDLVDAYVRATSDPDGTNERIIESKGGLI